MFKRTPSSILIVEDDEKVSSNIKEILADLGYNVSAFTSSGREAVKIITNSQPDLVLMDINLNDEKSGIEYAQQIRDRFDIPIVYLANDTDVDTLDQAKLTEPYGYILKPPKEKDLYATITLALYKHDIRMKIRDETENALAAIIGSAELILDEGTKIHKKESLAKVELIKRAAYIIKEYINKL